MKNGQIQIGVAIITALVLLGSSLLGAWGISSKQVAVVEERENNHYEELKNLIQANDDRQMQRWDEIKSVLDRIAPATVHIPKAETFPTKAEQIKKAPLITEQAKNGSPVNETEHD